MDFLASNHVRIVGLCIAQNLCDSTAFLSKEVCVYQWIQLCNNSVVLREIASCKTPFTQNCTMYVYSYSKVLPPTERLHLHSIYVTL